MSGYRLPAPAGAWVDRTRRVSFSFGGRPVDAFEGDTVASALLAAGVVHVARSFKLHRTRGVFSAGVEEPNALVDVGRGAARVPVTRMTTLPVREGMVCESGNAWPSLRWDAAALNARLAALLPAGFYYKTFMWPHWHRFEPVIRRLAGLGRAADLHGAARPVTLGHEEQLAVQTLVVGGGAAGRAAALAAARQGEDVLLLEALPRLEATAEEIDALRAAGVACRTGSTVVGLYDHALAVAVQVIDGVEHLLKLRAARTILAAGAFERPVLFPDNDRPSVMLAHAVLQHALRHGVACGRRVVVVAACNSAHAAAHRMVALGINVVAVVDLRPGPHPAPPPGVPVHAGHAVVQVHGRHAVRCVTIAPRAGGGTQRIDADCIASGGGFAPAVHLHSMAGGRLRWIEDGALFVPDGSPPGVVSVGACAGVFDAPAAVAHACAVGEGRTAEAPVGGWGAPVQADTLPALTGANRRGKVFIDLQNDVAADDVALAARENYRSVEHLKRYTTTGMATDQGKTSNVNALVRMGVLTGRAPAQVGTTRFRPPFVPVTLATLAAGRHGAAYRPAWRLPAHDWHLDQGALMEEFGPWMRPAAYPLPGETLEQAALREARHVRTQVGLFDATPLGKIEVVGPDAAAFLDLMYVGTLSTLPVGGARYAALLNENGVVFDDGIVARLGPEHFWVNTTSAGATRVVSVFEEWLQCEYVQHRVAVVPVHHAWGNVTVSGPHAWALLARAGFEAALAPTAMPHMTMRESHFAGTPVRVLRASFSGELGYEINLPAGQVQALFQRLHAAGQTLGGDVRAVPFGIEALMVLRIEKGYLHIGGDTDGTTLPGDVGLDRSVAKKAANFVGRRSLQRQAARDPARLQLVGLLPVDRRSVLPAGAHIAAAAAPAPTEGFVTSACFSPTLGHPVALALLAGGRQRIGEPVSLWHQGRQVAAEVVATPFVDAANERLAGLACAGTVVNAEPLMPGVLDVRVETTAGGLSIRRAESLHVSLWRFAADAHTVGDAVVLPACGRWCEDPRNGALWLWAHPGAAWCIALNGAAASAAAIAQAAPPRSGAVPMAFDQTDAYVAVTLEGPGLPVALARLADAQSVPQQAGQGTRLRVADVPVLLLRLSVGSVLLLAERPSWPHLRNAIHQH